MQQQIPEAVERLIGVAKTRRVLVTQRDITKFRQAIGDETSDAGTAPPLFFQALTYEEVPESALPADGSPVELDVPIPAERAVGGSSDYEIFRRARAGEELDVTTRLKNVYTKEGRSGILYFVVVETEFRDRDAELVARETATYIKRP